jgi:phage baseplate assembly protein W
MASLAVKLPITRNDVDGYTMIKDFKTLIAQNLKMLILTAPGERVMDPEFGVGIRTYLFENYDSSIYVNIERNIREQVKLYLPVVTIVDISFDRSTGNQDRNVLGIRLAYAIPSIGVRDFLEITT